MQIQLTIETLSGPYIDGVTKNGGWTMFDGQSMTIDPMDEERVIQGVLPQNAVDMYRLIR
jgi:hypothetical protein